MTERLCMFLYPAQYEAAKNCGSLPVNVRIFVWDGKIFKELEEHIA